MKVRHHRPTRTVSIGVATAIATLAAIAFAAAPANAGTFTQTWNNSAAYRASRDFIPNTNRVWAWGQACSAGDALAFVVFVVRTNDTHVMLATSTRSANDSWYKIDDIGVSAGTAYYMRWYGWGKDSAGSWSNGYKAPCQGVQATW